MWANCLIILKAYVMKGNTSPGYLVMKVWIRAMVMFLTFINVISLKMSICVKNFPRVGLGIGYWVHHVTVLWLWSMWHTLLS